MPTLAESANPLTTLTRKNQFTWCPSQQVAFESLKHKPSKTHVLANPNFSLPFILTTDASKVAVAEFFPQVQNGIVRPSSYASRPMNKTEQANTESESEMRALAWVTKYFRCYFFGLKFLAPTYHYALTYLRNVSDENQRLVRWRMKLSELHFAFEHRTGKRIPNVDALSQRVYAILNEKSD